MFKLFKKTEKFYLSQIEQLCIDLFLGKDEAWEALYLILKKSTQTMLFKHKYNDNIKETCNDLVQNQMEKLVKTMANLPVVDEPCMYRINKMRGNINNEIINNIRKFVVRDKYFRMRETPLNSYNLGEDLVFNSELKRVVEKHLTATEKLIFESMVLGKLDKEIIIELNLSEGSFKAMKSKAYKKIKENFIYDK